MNTIKGKIETIEETKTYGQKGFRKRLVVLTQDEGKWTNYVALSFLQDDCTVPDRLNVGDELEVEFAVKGRRWEKAPDDVRYFVDLEVSKIVETSKAPEHSSKPIGANRRKVDHDASGPMDEDCPF